MQGACARQDRGQVLKNALGQVIFGATRFENRLEVRGNRTGRGWFVKGHSGNPSGRSKNPPSEFAPNTDDPDGADRRTVGNLVVEARKYSGLAVDTLVELTKDNHTDSTRYAAATALLDRGYGRPAQSLDLHLSADAITKRLSDMTDAELRPRRTNNCRRTDCAGGNCGRVGRCRRRRGFPRRMPLT